MAALPEHHHLFADGGHGCFEGHGQDERKQRMIKHRPCGDGKKDAQATESKLPESYLPLELDISMDEKWEELVFGDAKPETGA